MFVCPAEGPELRTERDAVDLMSTASEHRPDLIVIPIERVGEDFLTLRTRIAGEFLQKFVMYGKHVVILGDISRRIAQSESLKSFVAECNRGSSIWFVNTMEELAKRCARLRGES